MTWTTLVDAEALAGALAAERPLRLVDARHVLADPDAGEAMWRTARLPGAVHAHLDRDLSGPHAPGAGRHPLPAPAAFAGRVREWGVAPGTQVVVYDAGDAAMAAARCWWLLRSLGHADVAVLDGGFARWAGLGLPLETQAPMAPVPATADHEAPAGWPRVVDAAGAAAAATRGVLVDARAPERFSGEVEPIDPVAGHVPGARNRPFAANLEPDGSFKARAVLRAEFDALLAGSAPGEAVVMCGSGVTACHHLLAMAHAGLDGARLYAGSWSGWIEAVDMP